MKMICFLLAFLLDVLSVRCLESGVNILKRDLRIFGGDPAVPMSVPYIVSIQDSKGHFCGGALIHRSWVLTAAHCNKGLSNMAVFAGNTELKVMEGTEQLAFPTRLVPHPQYNQTTKDNDIMLIKLSSPMLLNSAVSLVVLPKPESKLSEGRLCEVSGWGLTSLDQLEPSPVLHTVTVSVISSTQCNSSQSYNQKITRNMICAGSSTGGKDACRGDSGGPLVCGSRLFGLVSWGESCGDARFPGVYTAVSKYRHWIEQTISLRPACSKPTVK